MSIKLIETIIQNGGFQKSEDSKRLQFANVICIELKLLPGPHLYPPFEQDLWVSKAPTTENARRKRILIYFIGGITYGEIAAIRFLNKLFKDKKFIIATTQIINGETCIQMLRGRTNNLINIGNLLKK